MESRTALAYIEPIEYKKNSYSGLWRFSARVAGAGFRLKGQHQNSKLRGVNRQL
jgi:hypothetical protein